MAQRISTVSGVAQVQVYGPQKYAVRVQLDPRQLASRGIGIDEVADAVQRRQRQPADRHPLRPADLVHGPGQRPDPGRRRLPARDRRLPQRLPVRARATSRDVIDGVENDKTAAWYNDERSISLAIFKQPGTNTVEVAEARPQAAADVPEAAAGRGHAARPLRPLDVDPGLGRTT